MPQKNIKKKAVSGMIWTALQRYSTILIQFISGIILARLLTPQDYGCIGMLAIFIVLAETFVDSGFGSALIQKKNTTQVDYSTIFFWNLGMAVLLYVVLYLTAPAIARFYRIPLLCDVLRVQGIILFIYAFNIVQRNQLRKSLNFKVLSIVTITTSIISLLVTVILAYYGFGVWSLVVQNILIAAIPALVFWFYIKWRPIWTFSWQSFHEMFSFGFYMFLTQLLNQFGSQIQGLLIGKVYNASTMGYYSKAHSTEKLASHSISQVMTQVTYPLYAEVQDDKEKLSNMIRRLTMTLSFITFPMMFLLLLCAKPLFVLLYSSRWIGSVAYFQVLCLAGLAHCLQSVNYQSISAIGKSRTMFIWTFVKRFVGICFVIVGLVFYGMNGLLVGVVLNTWFSYFVNIGLVSKYIGYSWSNQLMDLFPILLASATSAIVSYGVGTIWNDNMYVNGLIVFITYIGLYVSWILLFKPEAYNYSKSTITPMIKKINFGIKTNK